MHLCCVCQEWIGGKERYAAHQGHEGEGGAEGEKEIQLHPAQDQTARWKPAARWELVLQITTGHESTLRLIEPW